MLLWLLLLFLLLLDLIIRDNREPHFSKHDFIIK